MTKIPYFEVVAFTDRLFAGNPAGVCLLADHWLPDDEMQNIAAENNLAETAFVVPHAEYFGIRWMTPTIEIDLCGHATLAAAHVILEHLQYTGNTVRFQSKTDQLRVDRADGLLVLDFPAQSANECELPPNLETALGTRPARLLKGHRDYYAVFHTQDEVAAIQPDLAGLMKLDLDGVVVTATGNDCDFVSRYFAPAAGIPEDPVTGSTHCVLIPYWSKMLGRRKLHARQISKRGGELFCEDRGERVSIGGRAHTYIEGHLTLPGSGRTERALEKIEI